LAITIPAVQKVRAASARAECSNHLRQLGIALANYHDSYFVLPAGCSNTSSDSMPFSTWMTRILPFIEETPLWEEAVEAYREDSWFESPPHYALLAHVLPLFTCPADGRTQRATRVSGFDVAFTAYQGVEGVDLRTLNGVLFANSSIHFSDITDGLSNTLLVGERPPSAKLDYGWWYAGWGQAKDGSADSVLGVRELNIYAPWSKADDCPPGPYSFEEGDTQSQCDAFHFWSLHPGGAHFLFCDGSVHFLSYTAARIIVALATRNGHEAVSLDE
jgi:prepilin-type processing-associated H-X9-DG protein